MSVFLALPTGRPLTMAAAVYIGTVRLGLRIIMATAWFDLGVVLPLNRALTASPASQLAASAPILATLLLLTRLSARRLRVHVEECGSGV